MMTLRIHDTMTQWLALTLLLLPSFQTSAKEITVMAVFSSDPPELQNPLKLNCLAQGDKIKISDIIYKISGCREFRPQDPTAEKNRWQIDQCTGKKTCAIPADELKPPFQPQRRPSCQTGQDYEIHVIFTCIQQDLIRDMCSGFTTQDYVGYLSSPRYPNLLPPGQPVAACRCDLEATLNSRVILTLLEVNLAGNSSDADISSCQTEETKQYLLIEYNHAMSEMYMLCGHKYNVPVQPSQTYGLMFENPIQREAGAIWMQYSAEDQNALVRVTCHEPVSTTVAPLFYTPSSNWKKGGIDYRMVLGIVAAICFVIIVVIIIIAFVKYRRNIGHLMLNKYSKTPKVRRAPPRHRAPDESQRFVTQNFELVDAGETSLHGKPTAHITPHLSFSGELGIGVGGDNPKCLNGKHKSSGLKSFLLSEPVAEDECQREVKCQHEVKSQQNLAESNVDYVSSKHSMRSNSGSNMSTFSKGKMGLHVDLHSKQSDVTETGRFASSTNHPDVGSTQSVSADMLPDETGTRRPSQTQSQPWQLTSNQQGADASSAYGKLSPSRVQMSDDEEMDIKYVWPNLGNFSPHCNRGTVGDTTRARQQAALLNLSPRSCRSLDYATPVRRPQESPRIKQRGYAVAAPISSFSHPSKLLADVGGGRKTQSMGGHGRRQNSVPFLPQDASPYAVIRRTPSRRSLSTLPPDGVDWRSDSAFIIPKSPHHTRRLHSKAIPPTPPRIAVPPGHYSQKPNQYARRTPEGRDDNVERVEEELETVMHTLFNRIS